MSDEPPDERGRAVPSGRLSRFGAFGRLAGGVAGGMMAEGARRLAAGERPRMRDMLLTPGNVARVADQLAHLRGAAMKLGQMISMDAGDLLPPELARIMGRLRERAHHMPPAQLQRVLAAHWGRDWRTRFAGFEPSPIAAASIGQVHRARTHDSRLLAIKVQYPGVAESIEADVDNVATLLRVARLLPAELDIRPLLDEAKRQLAEEADYVREGEQMARFGALLAGSAEFVVPVLDREFTTPRVLAMSFEEGVPVEALADAPQETRDRVMRTLMTLVLRELFEFGVMQTDPNFANYRFPARHGPTGAARLRRRPPGERSHDGRLSRTARGWTGQRSGGAEAGGHRRRHPDRRAGEAAWPGAGPHAGRDRRRARPPRAVRLRRPRLRRPAARGRGSRWRTTAPPGTCRRPTCCFAQRKISGTALLAARLGARVDVRALLLERLGG